MSTVVAQNYSPDELKHLREAGKILAGLFADFKKVAAVGMTGLDANDWFSKEIKARGARATYLDEDVKFPGVICVSQNDIIVHGAPKNIPFEKGDIVGFDLVIDVAGMKVDSAFTMSIGEEPTGAKKLLLRETERALYAGIDAINGATKIGDISKSIEQVLEKANLGIVRQLVGHGVGREMHEKPDIPNYSDPRTDNILLPVGNTVAIEPMATLGGKNGWKIVQDDPDGWSIRTADGSIGAHFEHTVLITENGAEILTQL
jgi:methionyl aminopeptidase